MPHPKRLAAATVVLVGLARSAVGAAAEPILTPAEVLRIVRSPGVPLGGRSEGASRIGLPGAVVLPGDRAGLRSVVATQRTFTSVTEASVDAILATTRELSNKGIFVELLGHAREIDRGRGTLHLVFEDMSFTRQGAPAWVAGDADALGHPRVRDLSVAARRQLVDEMVRLALLHPDGHGKNVVSRVNPGSLHVDVRLVDPFRRTVSPAERALWLKVDTLGSSFPDLYVPEVQARTWSERVGIPHRPVVVPGLPAVAGPRIRVAAAVARGVSASTTAPAAAGLFARMFRWLPRLRG